MERKEIMNGEMVFNADAEEALGGLSPEGRFAIDHLQSAGQLARDVAGASIFLLVVLPTDDDARARMLSFAVGCHCPTCEERAVAISQQMLTAAREVSEAFADRVVVAHETPGTTQ